ncbi:hypothetical protein P8452_59299 [Trifolium repens]|nr:hypothetical protein P8452_00405 [Trifolium repens]WJX75807.1 hypothetical protein P8452_59299 [Trifolium repens]
MLFSHLQHSLLASDRRDCQHHQELSTAASTLQQPCNKVTDRSALVALDDLRRLHLQQLSFACDSSVFKVFFLEVRKCQECLIALVGHMDCFCLLWNEAWGLV